MRTHRHTVVPRLRRLLGFGAICAVTVAAASTALAAPAETLEPFADASYREANVAATEPEPFADASYREANIALPPAVPPLAVDASYREANVAATEPEPFADASYREANVAMPPTVPPLAVDASYREASRVPTPVGAGDSFDWADGAIGGAVALGLLLVIGAGIAIWWVTTHHGPRHPRGPAVPSH